MNRIIRNAGPEDLEAIAAVEAACFPAAEAATREEFEERLQYYGSHFWLMFEGEKLIAFADGFVTNLADLTDEMYEKAAMHDEAGAWQMIFGVNTLPEYRGKGYAGELIRQAIRDACQQAIGGSGIRVCVENWHGYRPWQLGILDEMLESPAFGLTYDVGHNHCIGGADEPHIFARLSKLHHMHLHDVRDGTRDHQALGTGELDIHKYLELAKERDCSVVVETKTIEGLKESARWLHRNL